jgi:hypothetical protein
MTKARVKGTEAAAFVKSQAQLKVQESKVLIPAFATRWFCESQKFSPEKEFVKEEPLAPCSTYTSIMAASLRSLTHSSLGF